MPIRLTPTEGPYRGLVGEQVAVQSNGMMVVAFPPGIFTGLGASVSRGVFDPRWMRRVG
jgi:hypothetical protein